MIEVVYWQSPEQSVRLVTALILAAPVSFITFYLFSFQFILMISLWALVLSNLDFIRDFIAVIYRLLKHTDFKPIQSFFETKIVLISSYLRIKYERLKVIYERVTC